MRRSVRGWHLAAALLSLAVAGCSARVAPEAAPPAVAGPDLGDAAAPALTGVEAVRAAGLGKMWTFDNPPLDYLAERYDFRPGPDWFERVRLASLRYGRGCSASFVSPDGLVMTNHHCARRCIAAVSTPEHDYDTEGFYAASREDELRCPGLFLDQLVAIEDVTARVDAAPPAGVSREVSARLKREAAARIDEECESASSLRCQVVSLYQGGIYSLYKYQRYSDVRLAFAPESGAAFFGGDPDNFTYPRHDLDITFLRAYADGRPVGSEHYFVWSDAGAAEGELVFVTGNPGTTLRLSTVAQLEYMRDASHPHILQNYRQRLAVARELVAEDPTREPRYRNFIFSLENSIKAYQGYLGGLRDPELMASKRAWERSFRAAVMADPRLRVEYGDVWDGLARVSRELTDLEAERRLTSLSNFQLLARARDIVRLTAELAWSESERAYSAEEIAAVERRVGSAGSFNTDYERRLLVLRLGAAREALGPDHPFVRAGLAGRSPDAAARALYYGTQLADVGKRRALLEGGLTAVESSDDPAIVFVRAIDDWARRLEARLDQLDALETAEEERLAEALFQIYGMALPPDATFTLRLADGVVKGYPMNGTVAPYKTTFYGLYDRAASFDYQQPWSLTALWRERRDALDLSTPLNFVSTADIIGGNSGSPIINRNAEVVGVVFDGNIEMLPNRFLYRDDVARTVSTHSAAIIEALRKVYDAGVLADELEGVTATTAVR